MKYPLAIYCLTFILSCTNNPTAPPASQQIIVKDSNIIKKETTNPYVQVDVSPMDMAYFPVNYPVSKMNGKATELPMARVIYSRPHRGGRKLFGELVKWGQPWRLGANEATEIRFFQPVTIQNKRIEKGEYVLYAIPYEDKWTIVFNSNLYSWGLNFNPAKDVAKFEAPAVTRPQLIEHFTMTFEKTASGADLLMAWENTEVRLPIQF
jgi:hypothetical protein